MMVRKIGGSGATGRRAARWVGLVLAALLSGFVVLLAVGVVYRAVATAVGERRHPPPGELIDVGGHRMHLNVAGRGWEGPTVILDAGSQSASFQWGWVQPGVVKYARIVSYDRPGTGWSDAPPRSIEADEFAEDLHEALSKAGVGEPYLVVGHAMGSLTARAFAGRYPEDVVGRS